MIEGKVKISLKNVNTGKETYSSDYIPNTVLNTHVYGRNQYYKSRITGNVAGLDSNYVSTGAFSAARSFGGYNLLVGDRYIPPSEIDNNAFKFRGINWYRSRDSSVEPLTMEIGPEQIIVTVIKEVGPPLLDSSRNIHSVGIGYQYGTSIVPNMHSIASFQTPVVQTATDVAVVQYIITITIPASDNTDWYTAWGSAIENTGAYLNSTGLSKIPFYGAGSYRIGNLIYYHTESLDTTFTGSRSFVWNPSKTGRGSWNGTFVTDKINTTGGLYSTGQSSVSPTAYLNWDGTLSGRLSQVSTEPDLGKISGSFTLGNSSTTHIPIYRWASILPAGTNKTQSYFYKINTPTVPFFIPSEIATTDGTLVLDTSLYSPKIPEYWRIDFTGTSGGVGVAEYSFMKRYISGGFNNNTFVHRGASLLTPYINFSSMFNAQSITSTTAVAYPPLYKLDSPISAIEISCKRFTTHIYEANEGYLWQVTHTEILFTDLNNGIFTRINSTNYPSFTPYAFSAYEYDEISDTFWLACSETGIWKVQDPLGNITITNMSLAGLGGVAGTTQNKAYTLALGTNQGSYRTVWAIIEGALVKSVDNGSTWTAYDSTSVTTKFTQSDIEANWKYAVSMKSDKQNDNRLLILYYSGNTSSQTVNTYQRLSKISGIWWSSVNDTSDLISAKGPVEFFSNTSTSSEGWSIRHTNGAGTNFGQVSNNPYSASVVRRETSKFFGCTKNNSNWWLFSNWAVRRLDSTLNKDGQTPLEIYFEQQVDGTAGYTLFATDHWEADSGQSINYNSVDTAVPFHGGIYVPGFEEFTVGANTAGSNWRVFETSDDDGDDCLLLTRGLADSISDGIHKLSFLDHSSTLLSTDIVDDQYIGRGLYLSSDMNAINSIGAAGQPFGWNVTNKLIGEIWERYKWNGSSWVRRVDDNDPLTVKSTHATTDNLIGGATISFDDDGSTQSFSSGEAITTVVCDGILNDNLTSFTTYSSVSSSFESSQEIVSTTLALSTPSEQIPVMYGADLTGYYQSLGSSVLLTPGDYLTQSTDHVVYTGQIKSDSNYNHNTPIRYISGTKEKGIPQWHWSSGFTFNSTNSAYQHFGHSVRMKISEAATGDFNLISEYNHSYSNTQSGYQMVMNYTDNTGSPLVGRQGFLVWGMVDSSTVTDTASPETANTNVFVESDITYGVKISIPSNPFYSNSYMFSNTGGRDATDTTSLDTGYAGPIDSGNNNYSDTLRGYAGTEVLVEIVESGSVVFSYSDTWGNIANTSNSLQQDIGGYYDWDLAQGDQGLTQNQWTTISYYHQFYPLAWDNYFRIERVGTTIKYYRHAELLHTSSATSTESLIPCQYYEVEAQGATNAANFYAPVGNSFVKHHFSKPATNDYWVKVGQPSPVSGAYRTDFSHLQAALRQNYSIKINGVEATVAGLNENRSLVSGEVSIFPIEGLLKFSAADAGSTIDISMPCAYYSGA